MKQIRWLIAVLFFCSFNAFGQDARSAIERGNPLAEEEDGRLSISALLEKYKVPGVSIAVIRDFQIELASAYGIADVETGAELDSETLFQAASISKPVNAMAVLKAAQDGLFSIDADVNDLLSSWQIPESRFTDRLSVTPRMLASHVSGLGDGFGFPGYEPDSPLPTLTQIFDGQTPSNVGEVRMARPPMTAFHYSGGGVTVLQQLILDTYSKPYAELMNELVLQPVGMENSTFVQPLPPRLDRNAARAHGIDGKAMGPKWHVYPEQAAAGLWTTPSDLARFAIEVQLSYQGLSNEVLNQDFTGEMLSPVGVGPYAVGFAIEKRGEGWYFNHGGSNWGFRANLTAHKVKGYGYAIMTNASMGGRVINELARRIETAYEFDSQAEPVPR